MKTFRPQYYIKSNEKTVQYECVICNFIAEKPYTCNGPCKQNFCFQCMKVIRGNKNECPFRCSQPFQLTEGPQIQLEFRCPFNSEECKQIISSLTLFYEHNNVCKFLPLGWKEKEENLLRYKCDKSHNLYFMDERDLMRMYGFDQFFQAPVNSICSSCGQKGLCRTICPECSTPQKHIIFCTTCRKPPCTKQTCLYEHSLTKQHCYSQNLYCDFCGTRANLLGPHVFRDVKCNFDICEVCYINLPQTHQLVPFKMSKDAIKHLFKNHNGMGMIEEAHFQLYQTLFSSHVQQINENQSSSSSSSSEIAIEPDLEEQNIIALPSIVNQNIDIQEQNNGQAVQAGLGYEQEEWEDVNAEDADD